MSAAHRTASAADALTTTAKSSLKIPAIESNAETAKETGARGIPAICVLTEFGAVQGVCRLTVPI